MNPYRLDELEFIPYPHTYIVRGREIPSVTTLMRRYGLGFQGYAPQEALDRGNYVHEASVLIDEDDLEWSTVPEKWRGYLNGYVAARRADGPGVKVVAAERRLWHPEFWYAGTLDRAMIVIRDRVRMIRELKTGDATDVDAQVAAYAHSWNRWFPQTPVSEKAGECLRPNRGGGFERWDLDLEAGWRPFAACLVIEDRRRRNGRHGDLDVAA